MTFQSLRQLCEVDLIVSARRGKIIGNTTEIIITTIEILEFQHLEK